MKHVGLFLSIVYQLSTLSVFARAEYAPGESSLEYTRCFGSCRPSPRESRVLMLTNRRRREAGLAPLRWSWRLGVAARKHAVTMSRDERMEHELRGRRPGGRIAETGYRGFRWAENIFAGWGEDHDTPDMAVDWWMDSPSHRVNILDPRLTELGVGIRTGHDGKTYYCQDFGG